MSFSFDNRKLRLWYWWIGEGKGNCPALSFLSVFLRNFFSPVVVSVRKRAMVCHCQQSVGNWCCIFTSYVALSVSFCDTHRFVKRISTSLLHYGFSHHVSSHSIMSNRSKLLSTLCCLWLPFSCRLLCCTNAKDGEGRYSPSCFSLMRKLASWGYWSDQFKAAGSLRWIRQRGFFEKGNRMWRESTIRKMKRPWLPSSQRLM